MKRSSVTARASVLALAISALALPLAAHAQAAPEETPQEAAAETGEDVVITGSRIRRDPLDNPSPVTVVDDAAIAKTGLSSIADVLQRIPASSGGLNSKFNNSGNFGNPPDGGGVGAGSAAIDLRYLGAKRTLVLVDGLRYVNGASASGIPGTVDLNSIPDVMIERIEVLQSAASALYGSDAIGGVVNIITKSGQKGFRATAQYGQYLGDNDGDTQNYQLSWGGGNDRVTLNLGGFYTKQDPVRASDREISQFVNPGQTSCTDPIGGCSGAAVNGRILFNPGNPSLPAGGVITVRNAPLNGRGVYDPTLVGGDFRAFTNADRFNFAPYNYFLTPNERYGGFMNARAEFSDAFNVRLKATWAHRESQNQAAFLPLNIGPDAGNGNLLDTISVDATNPFNPFGITLNSGANGQPATYSLIGRRLVEAGQRTYNQSVDTLSVTGTIDGKFDLFGRNWYYDANAVFGFNDAHQLFTGNLNTARLAQALGPVDQCTGACVPFNIFGGQGSITPAMLAFVAFDEKSRSSQELQDYTFNVSGELFDLPGGPVGVAFGYEHRYQQGSFTPDPIIQAGLGADIPAQAARGSFDVDEVYGELRLPLIRDVPFLQLLELNGAVRHSDFSTAGGNTTLSGGALWKPVSDLLLRAQYAESFRAPSIGELFGAQSRFDQTLDDPCTSAAGGLFQSNATVRANCIANGVPASGSYVEPQGGQISVLTGGNVNVKPETAETWVFGGVYSPAWARNGFASALSLEVNYYDIKVDGAIQSIPAEVLLGRCAQDGDALSCAAVQRTPAGFISAINGVLLNTGGVRTRGVDATFNLRTRQTGAGTFGLSVSGNYLLKYEETVPATEGFTSIDYTGTERGSPDQAYPHFKGQATIDWDIGPVAMAFTGRYIDNVIENQGDNTLDSRFYADVQATFRPSWMGERFGLSLGVNNLFDKDPPACFSCSLNNYDPTTYDIPGRFGYARLSYGF
ncbi:TonB-dependent receptor domain-containing protein [Sphingomonas xinjiangensis]|uniref:Iron complex outermembrane receptor protein n=1 Tax=Sphingomonas xinjiangensis TaxID=643568 RepID=A0A840YD89_9SPHN|nr:TonB-dependent receptor [Sphingomonas xinjiangensis]MBB5710255.1 iron complex outermembrane receptor protein [Sphingomonas xinjiangensis]